MKIIDEKEYIIKKGTKEDFNYMKINSGKDNLRKKVKKELTGSQNLTKLKSQETSSLNIIILLLAISLLKFPQIYTLNKVELRLLSYDNVITLTIRGKGEQSIISDEFNSLPRMVIVNDEEITESINKKQNLSLERNIIKLIWDNTLSFHFL